MFVFPFLICFLFRLFFWFLFLFLFFFWFLVLLGGVVFFLRKKRGEVVTDGTYLDLIAN